MHNFPKLLIESTYNDPKVNKGDRRFRIVLISCNESVVEILDGFDATGGVVWRVPSDEIRANLLSMILAELHCQDKINLGEK